MNRSTPAPTQPHTPTPQPQADSENVFIARHPILDRDQQVIGYELLFRSGGENHYTHDDHEQATLLTIATVMQSLGLGQVVDGRKAFINITPGLLLDHSYEMLPAGHTVLELPADAEPTDALQRVCSQLKHKGYRLALDQYLPGSQAQPLLDYADMVKIDFSRANAHQRAAVVELLPASVVPLACKIEQRDQFEHAMALGYQYAQGFFFCQPQIIAGRALTTTQLTSLQFIAELQQPQLDFHRIEQIIRHDVGLSYHLLRYLNSAAMGVANRIQSVRQAMALLGERALRQWGSLLAVRQLNEGKPSELFTLALSRARFCETCAQQTSLRPRSSDLFLMGLFSCIDAMLDMPMQQVLEQLPIDDDIIQTLLGRTAGPLADLHALMYACERGEWDKLGPLLENETATEQQVADLYHHAMQWAEQTTRI